MVCTLIVSVIEGRFLLQSFTLKKYYLQGKLNNEILSSDVIVPPAAANSNSQNVLPIDTELAFEMTPRLFKLLKIKKEKIKLEMFELNQDGIGAEVTRKLLGYVMIDLRKFFEEKWVSLVSSTSANKIKLKIGFKLEDEEVKNIAASPKKTFSPSKKPLPFAVNLIETLNEICIEVMYESGNSIIEQHLMALTIRVYPPENSNKRTVYCLYLKSNVETKNDIKLVSDTFDGECDIVFEFKLRIVGSKLQNFMNVLASSDFQLFSLYLLEQGGETPETVSKLYFSPTFRSCRYQFRDIMNVDIVCNAVTAQGNHKDGSPLKKVNFLSDDGSSPSADPKAHNLKLYINFKSYHSLNNAGIVRLRLEYEPLLHKTLKEIVKFYAYAMDNVLPDNSCLLEFQMDPDKFYKFAESVALQVTLVSESGHEVGKGESLMTKLRGEEKDYFIGSNAYNKRIEDQMYLYHKQELVGTLNFTIILEDFGLVNKPEEEFHEHQKIDDEVDHIPHSPAKVSRIKPPSEKNVIAKDKSERLSPDRNTKGSPIKLIKNKIRKTQEYEAALQLEQWKIDAWESLKKELMNLPNIEVEKIDYTSAVQAQLKSLAQIESKLKNIFEALDEKLNNLSDMKEKHVSKDVIGVAEDEIENKKLGVELKLREIFQEREVLVRELEDLRSKNSQLRNHFNSITSEIEDKENLFRSLHQKSDKEDDVLREIAKLQSDKKLLEAELAKKKTTKEHYKNEWKKSVTTLLRMKNDMLHDQEKDTLSKIKEADDNAVILRKSQGNEKLKEKLDNVNIEISSNNNIDLKKFEIERLRREIKVLLDSGIYNPDDKVIKVLEIKINDLVTRKG